MLHEKGELKKQIKFANQLTLRWRDYSGLSRSLPESLEIEGDKKSPCQSYAEGERFDWLLLALKMEAGHKPRNPGNLQKLEKASKQIAP